MTRTSLLLPAALLLAGLSARAAAPDTEAVEFYNAATGHYFITASASEAVGVDAGAAGPGWLRTGRSFQAWTTRSVAPADASPVCRFYSSGANSHFYTASANECAQLKSMEAAERRQAAASGAPVRGWAYEGIAFYVEAPGSGGCPAGTSSLVRLYNNGFATGAGSNHRFVDDPALESLMIDRGWIPEGAFFCAESKHGGTDADLAPTVSGFSSLAGHWTGTAQWKTESAGGQRAASRRSRSPSTTRAP